MSRSRLAEYAVGAVGAAVAICLWQIAAVAGPLAASPLPTAGEAISAMFRLLGTADMWEATWDTIVMAIVGLTLSTVAGVVMGIGIGISPLAMHATRVPLEFLKPIPPIVVLPVVVLVLGPTSAMGIVIVFIGCFVGTVVQAAAGVYDTDPVATATGRSYGLSRAAILRNIVLPSSLPFIFTSIRVSAPISVVAAVVAGLLGGGPGLGQSLLLSQITGNQPELFAYVLILGLLGLIVQGLSRWLEAAVLHWHPQYRKQLV